MMALPDGGKKLDHMCICLDTVPRRDGQTDRHREGLKCHDSIAPLLAHADHQLMRDNYFNK